MDFNPQKKPSVVKSAVKGVIFAGAATVVVTGAVGALPVLALPIAAAGALYAKSKARPQTEGQKVKMWGVVAGVGITVATLMHVADMVPTIAVLGFGLGSTLPYLGNRLKDKLTTRRSTPRGVIESRPANRTNMQGRDLPGVQAPQPGPATVQAQGGVVNVEVPADMAARVAQFVDTLKAQQQSPQSEEPRRTPYRPV